MRDALLEHPQHGLQDADKTFGLDDNTVHILRLGSSHVIDAGPAPKEEISAAVWDAVQQIL